MSYNSPSVYNSPPPPPQPQAEYLPIPVGKPYITYVLLASIVIVWGLMELSGGSSNTQVLLAFGANAGWEILANGEVWRLFTSMFLHIGFMHLAFNAYALFIFGVEMERLYGSDRYLVVYILSGLLGSLLSFAARGPNVLSAGASGAIFGVIGMNLAYFYMHRDSFGHFGRQRMISTVVIIVINLVFGFTVPGIDNFAHLGGLVGGFVLGWGLAPRYEVDRYVLPPRVVDKTSLMSRWWVPTLAVVILVAGVYLSMAYWLTRLGAG